MTNSYIGSELELFAAATKWKAYFASVLAPFIGARVLEIGAGIGSNISFLHTPAVRHWTSVEPDPDLARRITERVGLGELPETCRVLVGTIEGIEKTARFNTVFYIDVLEHIADDAAELNCAASHLAPNGNLVVLAPAHQFLFSEFDAAIGHHRRYNAVSLTAVTPLHCRLRTCFMLDYLLYARFRWFFRIARQPFPARRDDAVNKADRLLGQGSRTCLPSTRHSHGT